MEYRLYFLEGCFNSEWLPIGQCYDHDLLKVMYQYCIKEEPTITFRVSYKDFIQGSCSQKEPTIFNIEDIPVTNNLSSESLP